MPLSLSKSNTIIKERREEHFPRKLLNLFPIGSLNISMTLILLRRRRVSLLHREVLPSLR